jgi:hypothetical protein
MLDHHDTLHVTSRTIPSPFSACNIEKVGWPGDEARFAVHETAVVVAASVGIFGFPQSVWLSRSGFKMRLAFKWDWRLFM